MPQANRATGHKSPRSSQAEQIVRAVRRSLNMPRLRVEARRVRLSTFDGWRVRLLEHRRVSEPVELQAPAIDVVKKRGLIPPEYHGDLRIALAGIREDWRAK